MPSYTVEAINVGTFNLGESDKLLTLFTSQRGLMKAVAKGARKPGAKMTGKSELLNINTLFLSTGRSLDIISQAETLETFPGLRKDLSRLTFGLYYAELSQIFGQGLEDDSATYFNYLRQSLRDLSQLETHPPWMCLKFELGLLDLLGLRPELTMCVSCRQVLTDYTLSVFHKDWGGILCTNCLEKSRPRAVREESTYQDDQVYASRASVQITPSVWKQLILASLPETSESNSITSSSSKPSLQPSLKAAQRLIQGYIEHRAGRRIKSLDVLAALEAS